MPAKHYHETAKRLLKEWNANCSGPMHDITPRDRALLARMMAAKFEFYVQDGINFADIPTEVTDEAIRKLARAVKDMKK